MSRINKILLTLLVLLFLIVAVEIGYYLVSSKDNATTKKPSSTSTTGNKPAPTLTQELMQSCTKNRGVIQEMNNIERDLKEKTLNSVTMNYSFTIDVVKIEAPCTRDYGGYPLSPDLCIVSEPKEASRKAGKKIVDTIYKFAGTPVINVFQKGSDTNDKITLADIKPGDRVVVTSVHDLSQGNETPFFNYDNVTELTIVKQ